jgi:hypothetical protein
MHIMLSVFMLIVVMPSVVAQKNVISLMEENQL